VLWAIVMYQAVWRRHDRYGSFDLDLGFHTQFVWQLAHGRTFSTVLGLHAFGHNATFGYFLLVPLSWIGIGGPHTLNLLQTLAVASGTAPVYVLARRRLGHGWPAVALALAWLLHPLAQNQVWETFHPEVIAAPLLLWAYVAADRSQWKAYWVLVGLAIIWKTDVALFVMMLGAWVALRRSRRVGVRTIALGAAWAFVMLVLVVPRFSGGGTVYGGLYGDLGDTPAEVVGNSIAHPSRLARHVVDAEPIRYGRDLLAPYGFVPLIAPAQVALALPQYAVNVLPDDTSPRTMDYAPHYQALPMVALTLALVEAAGWVRRRRADLVAPLCGTVVACAVATSVAWGSLPFGVRWHQYWSEDDDPLRSAKDAAVATVANDHGVSSQYLLTAHLAEREVAYTFPNPWRKQYYGVESTPRGDPAEVEWLVLDDGITNDAEREVLACILDAGTFEEVFRDGAIVVYRRIERGAAPQDLACS
jgi:uncharacterized membrane protein